MKNKIAHKKNKTISKWVSAYESLLVIKKIYWFLFVIGILFLLSLVVVISVIFGSGVPSKYSVGALDKYMVMLNQNISWYAILIFSIIAILLYIAHLIVSIALIYTITIKKIDFTDKKLKFSYGVFSFFAILIPAVFSIYFFWVIYDGHLKDLKSKKSSLYKRSLALSLCLTPCLAISVVVPSVCIRGVNIQVDQDAIKENFTYSTNKNNLIIIVMNEGFGGLWNQLLKIDSNINGTNSFQEKFSEFTSFINAVSVSDNASFSNLMMNGSLYFSPFLLGQNFYNPLSFIYLGNQGNNSNVEVKWEYYNNYSQQTFLEKLTQIQVGELFFRHEFGSVSYLDYPYWNDSIINFRGNYASMNEKLNEFNKKYLSDSVSTSKKLYASATSSTSILKNKNLNFDNNNLDSARYFDLLTNKSNLIFTNTETSTVKYLYNSAVSGLYSYKENGKFYRTNENIINYIKSLWYAMQDLKSFFNELKSTNHTAGGTVYDHSMIMVISENGTNLPDNAAFKNEYHNFWKRFNFGNNTEYKEMENFFVNNGYINPIFMIKPFTENKTSGLTNLISFYDTTNLISTSDIPLIIDAEMRKLIEKQNPTISTYYPESYANYLPPNFVKYIKDKIIIDPLNNLEKSNLREINVLFGRKKWNPGDENFDIWANSWIKDFNITKNIYKSKIEFYPGKPNV